MNSNHDSSEFSSTIAYREVGQLRSHGKEVRHQTVQLLKEVSNSDVWGQHLTRPLYAGYREYRFRNPVSQMTIK
jgi:hypothetical protein